MLSVSPASGDGELKKNFFFVTRDMKFSKGQYSPTLITSSSTVCFPHGQLVSSGKKCSSIPALNVFVKEEHEIICLNTL